MVVHLYLGCPGCLLVFMSVTLNDQATLLSDRSQCELLCPSTAKTPNSLGARGFSRKLASLSPLPLKAS